MVLFLYRFSKGANLGSFKLVQKCSLEWSSCCSLVTIYGGRVGTSSSDRSAPPGGPGGTGVAAPSTHGRREEEAGRRQRSKCTPHLAMHPPSSHSPYSLLLNLIPPPHNILLLPVIKSSISHSYLPACFIPPTPPPPFISPPNFHTMGGRSRGAGARAREAGHIVGKKQATI